ncbi:MAG TPA: hypothetical protein VN653_08495 [Anaerolineales bacterium]|nr:hypothetical protein [Anaerolineales bacterium]
MTNLIISLNTLTNGSANPTKLNKGTACAAANLVMMFVLMG